MSTRLSQGSAALAVLVATLVLAGIAGTAHAQIRVAVEDFSGQGGGIDTAAQLNDDTYFDFTATVVVAADIDTAAELANYDVVIVGDPGNRTVDWNATMAAAIRAFVEGGGGIVGSGWVNYGIRAGYPWEPDFSFMLPTVNAPSTNEWTAGGATLDLTVGPAHPITNGLVNFSPGGNNIEVNRTGGAGPNDVVLGAIVGAPGDLSVVYEENIGAGNGRGVYLGPLYMANTASYGTAPLRLGDPDRLLEQAVAWAAGPQGPEMDVQRPAGTSIADGGNDALGNLATGSATPYTYTIENTGGTDLNLTGAPLVTATANTNCTVNVTTQPTTPVTASGGTTTFVVEVTVTALGAFDFDISIDNDDANENPYNFNVAGTGITAAEMDVQRPAGTSIADGGNDALGNVPVTVANPYTYTIENTGSDPLNLTGAPLVSATANTNCTVTVTTQPVTPIPLGGGITTFVVEVTVTAIGAFDFDISIDNDDADENPYDFNVAGTGVIAPEIDVQRPAGTSMPSGGNDNVGNLSTTTPTDITYTIANTGVNDLNLTGTPPDYVTLSGEVNCTAIVFTQPTTPIAAGNTTTFIVRIQPTTVGAVSVLVTILNDDADEGTYTFTITGNGVTTVGGGGGGCCSTASDPATHPGNAFLLLLAAVLLLVVPVVRRRL